MDDITIISNHGVVFCKSCVHAVRTNVLSKHLMNVHKMSMENSRLKQQELDKKKVSNDESRYQLDLPAFNGVVQNNFVDGEVFPLISFLPILTAWQCKACLKIMGSAESGRKHVASCKKIMGEVHCCLEIVRAQALYGGHNRRYFRLEGIEDGNNEEIHWWLTRMIGKLKGSVPSANMNNSYDSRMRDGFLEQMGFDTQLELLDGLTLTSARNLCLTYEPNDEKMTRFLMKSYFKKAFDTLRTKIWTKSHSFMGEEFHLELTESSLARYLGHAVVLFRFFKNAVGISTESSNSFVLHDGMNEEQHTLTCSQSSRKFLSGANGCDNIPENILVNDNRVEWLSLLPKLHTLLKEWFLIPFKGNIQLVPYFLACYSVVSDSEGRGRVQGNSVIGMNGNKFSRPSNLTNSSLRYCTASEMSPMLAALKYLIQCVVINEVYGDGDQSFSDKWIEVEKWESSRVDNGASYVHYAMRVAMRVKGSEGARLRFIKCPQHERCGIIDGSEVKIESVAKVVKDVQRKVWELATQRLLFGVTLGNSFWEQVHGMRDCIRDRTPGYWFGSHPDNAVSVNMWLNRISKNLRISRIFKNKDVENLDKEEARQYVEDCQKMQAWIYVLCQLTGGGPARSTEAAIIQCRNTSLGPRNIILTKGQIAIASFYHKGRSKAGGISKPILRFPDAVTGGVMTVYLLLIKPFEMALARKLGLGPAEEEAWVDQDMLFSYRGLRTNESRLRTYFENEMKDGGIPIGTAQYRQYYTGVVKHFFNDKESLQLDTGDTTITDVMHRQAGHSEDTAHEFYGVSDTDMRKLTSSELEAFRFASEKWHRLLGIGHGRVTKFQSGADKTLEAKKNLDADISTTGIQYPYSLKYVEKNEIVPKKNVEKGAAVVFTCDREVKNTELCTQQSHHIRVLADKIDSMIMLVKRFVESQSLVKDENGRKGASGDSAMINSEQEKNNEEITAAPSKRRKVSPEEVYKKAMNLTNERQLQLCGYLQRALGTDVRAKFWSKEQEIAAHFICAAMVDTLLVLPTGGGKSLLYIMAAIANPEKVVVVIVPTIALQVDIARRCEGNGINVGFWAEREAAELGVLLVSAEHVSSIEYKCYIKRMYVSQRLHCVVVDEAHLFTSWSHFRQSMKNISDFIRPPDVCCALIAQSATIPPTEERKIMIECGLQPDHTVRIRSRTSRKNIRYETHVHRMQDLFYEIAMTLSRLRRRWTSRACSGARIVIYCTSHSDCQQMSEEILDSCNPTHFEAFVYHAGIDKQKRIELYKKWAAVGEKKIAVICATSAFGCGVDISNIRIVIHAGVPYSVSDFSQESGRCARDGQPGHSLLFLPIEASSIVSARVSRTSLADLYSSSSRNKYDMRKQQRNGVTVRETTNKNGTAAAFLKWMDEKNFDCRRWTLDAYLDGVTEKLRCFERKFECCDACERYQNSVFANVKMSSSKNDERKNESENCIGNQSITSKVERRLRNDSGRSMDLGNEIMNGNECSNHCSVELDNVNDIRKNLFSTESGEESRGRDRAQKKVYGSSASELMRLARDLEVMCPVCSVENLSEVYHSENKVITPQKECFKGRCLRCASKSHRFHECPLRHMTAQQSPTNSKSSNAAESTKCFQCGLGAHQQSSIHECGTFGNKQCSLKRVVRLAVVAWEHSEWKTEITRKFPDTVVINSTPKFVEWCTQYENAKSTELNIASIAEHIINNVIDASSKNYCIE